MAERVELFNQRKYGDVYFPLVVKYSQSKMFRDIIESGETLSSTH